MSAVITPAAQVDSAAIKPRLEGCFKPRNTGNQRALNPHTESTGNPHAAKTRKRWSNACGIAGLSPRRERKAAAPRLISSRMRKPTVDATISFIHVSIARRSPPLLCLLTVRKKIRNAANSRTAETDRRTLQCHRFTLATHLRTKPDVQRPQLNQPRITAKGRTRPILERE